MYYQAELNFLCNTLEKCHMQTAFLNPYIPLDEKMEWLEKNKVAGLMPYSDLNARYAIS